MMANNVKKSPIVVMSQINTTSSFSGSSSTTSVSAESKPRATTSTLVTQNNVSIGDLQCCGKWFSSSKSFHRHLVDAAQTDPQHESKLFQIGMRRCSLCPMWVHKNAMTQHIKRNHTTKIANTNSASDTAINRIQGQHQGGGGGGGNRVTIPNVKKNDQLPGSLGSRGAPGYIIRVSGQPQQFVRVGMPAQQINRVAANTVKPPNTGHKAQFKNASGSMLPASLANTVITDKNGQTLGYKVGGTQFVTKKTISADGVQKLTIGTLGSVRKILPVAKGAELQKHSRSEFTNSGNQDNMIYSSPMSKGESFSPLAHNRKNIAKTYKGTNPSNQIIRKNVAGSNISYKVLQQPSETVEIASPVDPIIDTSTDKMISKKKRKQVLSPSIESVDTVTIDKDTAVGMYTKVKEIKRPIKKQKSSPASVDNSMIQNDNVTPKYQKKNSRGAKSASNKKNDGGYTPVATSSGRGKGRKKAPGRPGRPRRIVMENPEPNESDSYLGIKGDDENIENEPEMDMKHFKVEENVPEVELDLFTLPSVSEKQFSVLLVEPKNPSFKVYASMDAIFVGDSALGDVTNQLGYITDMNNVVFVNPEHFLFPNVKDIDNFVPRPLLIMKCSKNMNLQSKTQANSNENMKSPISKTDAVRDNQADIDIPADGVTQEEETRLIKRDQILRYLQGATPEKKLSSLKDSSSSNIVSPLNDTKQTEPKITPTEIFSDVHNSSKSFKDHAASVSKETPPTPCESNLGNVLINLDNNSSETLNMPNTIENKTKSTLEENNDGRRIKNISDYSNDDLSTLIDKELARDEYSKEIKKDASYKILENDRVNKVETIMDLNMKSEKVVLNSPRHSLINSPSSGLLSTKLGLKIPNLVTGLKKLEETDICKGVDKLIENKKKVNEMHVMPEPIKFTSPIVNKTKTEQVSGRSPKIIIGLKQKEAENSEGVEKFVGSIKELNKSHILPDPVKHRSPAVNSTMASLVGREIPKIIPRLKQIEKVDGCKGEDESVENSTMASLVDREIPKIIPRMKQIEKVDGCKGEDESVENKKKVSELLSMPVPDKSSSPVVNDKTSEHVSVKTPKLVTELKHIEETYDNKDVDKSVENMKNVNMLHIMSEPVKSSPPVIHTTKTEPIGREISIPISGLKQSEQINDCKDVKISIKKMEKVNDSLNMSEQLKSSSPAVDITKTELVGRKISTPISGSKQLEDVDDCKDVKRSIENMEKVNESYSKPEPLKSSSPVVNTTKTELVGKEIPKLSPRLDQLEDIGDCKTVDKSVENKKKVDKFNLLSDSVESSLPVVSTDKTEIVGRNLLGVNSENDHSQIRSPLKQDQKNSQTTDEDKLSIPVKQNSQCLSSRVSNNKIDEPLKETDKSDNKKSIKSLRTFRSKSIDSPSTKEIKLSDEVGKTETVSLPEKETKFVSGTDRLQKTHEENLSSGSDAKGSFNSKVSIDNIENNTLHSGKVEKLEEDSKILEDNNTPEELRSKKKKENENENQISKSVLPITNLKAFRSNLNESETSIPDDSKLNKLSNVPSDCKKSKFGSPPVPNRDIRSFFQHTPHDASSKPAESTKSIEKAPLKTAKDDKSKMVKDDPNIGSEEKAMGKTFTKDNSKSITSKDDSSKKSYKKEPSKSSFKSENTQETIVHSENPSVDYLGNVIEKINSVIKDENIISDAVENYCENDRLSTPPNKNIMCKKNKTTDIRDFFSPEKGKKRTSLELDEKPASLELNESNKKVKTEQEPDNCHENIEIKSSTKKSNLPSPLKLTEIDFVGFDESLSISQQRSHLLSEIVNRLTLKHNIRKEDFVIPLDQVCDSEEQLLLNRIFTSR